MATIGVCFIEAGFREFLSSHSFISPSSCWIETLPGLVRDLKYERTVLLYMHRHNNMFSSLTEIIYTIKCTLYVFYWIEKGYFLCSFDWYLSGLEVFEISHTLQGHSRLQTEQILLCLVFENGTSENKVAYYICGMLICIRRKNNAIKQEVSNFGQLKVLCK